MKRLLLPLLAVLVLAGCGMGAAELPPQPTVAAVTRPPDPTPSQDGLAWGVNFSTADIDTDALPTKLATALDEANAVEQNGVPFFLLGEAADVSLYGFWLSNGDGVLIRRGDELACFQQSFSDPALTVPPELRWADLDGDGAEELGVIYSLSGDAGCNASQLHVYEWDGGWTDHFFAPEDYGKLLSDNLDVQTGGNTLTVKYGGIEAHYTAGPGDTAAPTLCEQYETMIFFSFGKDKMGVVVPLRIQAGFHIFASLSADVDYEDGAFRLSNIQLISAGGV